MLLKPVATSINVLSKYLKKKNVRFVQLFKYDQLAQINCPNPDCDGTVGSSMFSCRKYKSSRIVGSADISIVTNSSYSGGR